ncbi:uncharacterized protein LOC118183729 [Stegodyphus dumicola]|uniref:uncharacterized protein LOC118183729 n=1 Tax=Stegodyphus dumicola TaxID=202533 RepID=UPI0015A7A3DB|nr:uncharacterized protein LOC118183729 [Stegodyphus dumicola]
MIGQNMAKYTLIAVMWIYSIFAAPLAADEEVVVIQENMTHSCLKDSLPEKMESHYDMCSQKNETENEMMNDNMILLCILKAGEMINEEEAVNVEKLKMMIFEIAVTEETKSDTMAKDVHESSFNMAVQKCETSEENMMKASNLVQCLLENLSMNCTKMVKMDEEIMPMMDAMSVPEN